MLLLVQLLRLLFVSVRLCFKILSLEVEVLVDLALNSNTFEVDNFLSVVDNYDRLDQVMLKL